MSSFFNNSNNTYYYDNTESRHIINYPIIPNVVTDFGATHGGIRMCKLFKDFPEKFNCLFGFDNSDVADLGLILSQQSLMIGTSYAYHNDITCISKCRHQTGETYITKKAGHWFYTFDSIDLSGNITGLTKITNLTSLPPAFLPNGKRVFIKELNSVPIGNKLRLDHCMSMCKVWESLITAGYSQACINLNLGNGPFLPININQSQIQSNAYFNGDLNFDDGLLQANGVNGMLLIDVVVFAHEFGHGLDIVVAGNVLGKQFDRHISEFFADFVAFFLNFFQFFLKSYKLFLIF